MRARFAIERLSSLGKEKKKNQKNTETGVHAIAVLSIRFERFIHCFTQFMSYHLSIDFVLAKMIYGKVVQFLFTVVHDKKIRRHFYGWIEEINKKSAQKMAWKWFEINGQLMYAQ